MLPTFSQNLTPQETTQAPLTLKNTIQGGVGDLKNARTKQTRS